MIPITTNSMSQSADTVCGSMATLLSVGLPGRDEAPSPILAFGDGALNAQQK